MILIFANNAATTLLNPITVTTPTTCTLAAGTGSLFPSPAFGQYFILTLTNPTSGANEVVWVTARSGDTLTIAVRGAEGTSPTTWIAGTAASCFPTAGTQGLFVQPDQLQDGLWTYSTAAGTANALTTTVPSTLTQLPNGFTLILNSAYVNTGAATLTITLGSNAPLSYPIIKGNNLALIAGDIPIAGYPMELVFATAFGSSGSFVMNNPATIYPPTFSASQLQQQYYTYAVATGGADTLAVTIPSSLVALTDGLQVSFKAAYANATTTPTLNLTLGSTATGAKTIKKWANAALNAGDISGAGYICQMVYSTSGGGQWLFLNPVIPVASSPVTSFSAGTTGLTPNIATTGPITLAGTLVPANGGTGAVTIPVNGAIPVGNGTNYTVTTITAGTGISVTNGAGTITIANLGISAYPGAGVAVSNGTGGPWGTSLATTGTGSVVLNNGATLIAPILGTPVSGVLSLCTNVNLGSTGFPSGVLGYANGGTASSSAPTQGGVAYGTGIAFAFSALGTAGQVLQSNGSGAPSWLSQASMTVGAATNATNLVGSGSISGTTTGVTKPFGTNDTTMATTAFVELEIVTYVPFNSVSGGSWHTGASTSGTNSYGYGIHVSFLYTQGSPGSNPTLSLTCNGILIDYFAASASGCTLRVIGFIPNGATWVVTPSSSITLTNASICY